MVDSGQETKRESQAKDQIMRSFLCCRKETEFNFAGNVFFFLSVFMYFKREQAAEGQRGGHRIRSRLCADSREPNVGLKLTNHEIVT